MLTRPDLGKCVENRRFLTCKMFYRTGVVVAFYQDSLPNLWLDAYVRPARRDKNSFT